MRRALQAPQRRNKENITRATFAAEPNFPYAGARINYNAIFCAVEGMPAGGLVMRRCLYRTRTRYARSIRRASRSYRGGSGMRYPRTWRGRYSKRGHDRRGWFSCSDERGGERVWVIWKKNV